MRPCVKAGVDCSLRALSDVDVLALKHLGEVDNHLELLLAGLRSIREEVVCLKALGLLRERRVTEMRKLSNERLGEAE